MRAERKADPLDPFSEQLELFDPDDDGLDFGGMASHATAHARAVDEPRLGARSCVLGSSPPALPTERLES
jgi:hypothetical protein